MIVNLPEIIDLMDASDTIGKLRASLLFEMKENNVLSSYAEQSLLIALAHLDLAQRHLKIAWMEALEKR
jgi:hypothetical protein